MQVCSENQEETHFRALEYIRQRAYSRPESPFFLVASYHHPHDPFHVTQELWDLYQGQPIAVPDLPENLDKSYSEMDRWVNEVHGVHQVNLLDLLPTLLDLAGVAANRLPADGRSLTPLLAGAEEPARTIFSEYHVEKVKPPLSWCAGENINISTATAASCSTWPPTPVNGTT